MTRPGDPITARTTPNSPRRRMMFLQEGSERVIDPETLNTYLPDQLHDVRHLYRRRAILAEAGRVCVFLGGATIAACAVAGATDAQWAASIGLTVAGAVLGAASDR